ncbi:TonB-dependent receptor [Salinisphaera sp. Q1T1-3]|uniref:TonB-dependent receptor n=1 Tax=Salinisphaera sp. Q1T1-3 TaxID=2321229 RepID=UPI000E71E2D3|nr:TonB-dependent receptor [Salinisphaera sp. Q1T1-3]RJS93518.1 TonB-dependent receptor [Salinisphaera sp. Q1T1-3]
MRHLCLADRRVAAGLFCLAAALPAPGEAEDVQRGAITGRVTDVSGKHGFDNASIRLDSLDREITTRSGGYFYIDDLPAGHYHLTVSYLGGMTREADVDVDARHTSSTTIRIGAAAPIDEQPVAAAAPAGGATATAAAGPAAAAPATGTAEAEAPTTHLSDLLVIGQTANRAAALNARRSADTLVNMLSDDAVGDFPDINAAEAVARAPGVNVERDQGEGRFAVIRGIAPQYNSTRINGVHIPGTEAGSRAVNLDVIPSDLIGSVDIHKAVTPDMDADAVGGDIDVNTLSAFDVGHRQLKLKLGANYSARRDKGAPDLSATYSDLFSIGGDRDNLGVVLAVVEDDRDFASDGIETGDGWFETETPRGDTVRALESGEQRDYLISRDRTSAALNVDFHPTDASQYYWRSLYSRMAEHENKRVNIYNFDEGETVALSGDAGRFRDANIEREVEYSNKRLNIFTTTLGGDNDLGPWHLDYNAAYTRTGEDSGDPEIDGTFVADGLDIGYDRHGDAEQPRFFGNAAADDASRYVLDDLAEEAVDNTTEEIALAFNARRNLRLFGHAGHWKAGWKTRLRHATNDVEATAYEAFDDVSLAGLDDTHVHWPKRGDFGPQVDTGDFREFYHDNKDAFSVDEVESDVDSRAEDYDIHEDIHAGYFLGQTTFGQLDVLAGVRVEYTDFSADGTRVTEDETDGGQPALSTLSRDKDYVNVFPGLHLKYHVTDRLEILAAATRTIARPSLEEAAPTQSLEITREADDSLERNAEIGNPDLEPLTSNNFDLRATYYPGRVSVLSAGVFYKDIDNFFVTADTAGSAPFADYDEVRQTVNGDSAHVVGVELEYTQSLAFLPSPFDGLLFDANYTYTDSAAHLPGRDKTIPLPGQSDHSANVSLGYEKSGFDVRVAAKYRSAFFDEAGDYDDPRFDRYQDDHVQIDLSSRYALTNHLSVYFNAVNLNDEPLYAYFDSPGYNAQHESYGRSYQFGFKARF